MLVTHIIHKKESRMRDSFLCISTVYIIETSAFRFNHTLCA